MGLNISIQNVVLFLESRDCPDGVRVLIQENASSKLAGLGSSVSPEAYVEYSLPNDRVTVNVRSILSWISSADGDDVPSLQQIEATAQRNLPELTPVTTANTTDLEAIANSEAQLIFPVYERDGDVYPGIEPPINTRRTTRTDTTATFAVVEPPGTTEDSVDEVTENRSIWVDGAWPEAMPLFNFFKDLPDLASLFASPYDLNGDGKFDFADFLKLAGNFGKTPADFQDGDIDGDGIVGFSDFLQFSQLRNDFGNDSFIYNCERGPGKFRITVDVDAGTVDYRYELDGHDLALGVSSSSVDETVDVGGDPFGDGADNPWAQPSEPVDFVYFPLTGGLFNGVQLADGTKLVGFMFGRTLAWNDAGPDPGAELIDPRFIGSIKCDCVTQEELRFVADFNFSNNVTRIAFPSATTLGGFIKDDVTCAGITTVANGYMKCERGYLSAVLTIGFRTSSARIGSVSYVSQTFDDRTPGVRLSFRKESETLAADFRDCLAIELPDSIVGTISEIP